MSSCFVLTVALWFACAQAGDETAPSLPSITYWQATFDIVRKRAICGELDISPEQIRQVAALRDDKGMAQQFANASQQILANGGSDFSPAYAARELTIREGLSIILAPEQMALLKTVQMRLKYPQGHLPFADEEVWRFLSIPASDVNRFKQAAPAILAKHHTAMQRLVDARCTKILEYMPAAAQQKFVRFVGNRYLPTASLPADDSIENLPFRSLKSVELLRRSASDEAFQKLVGLSARQIEQLAEIDKATTFEGFGQQTKFKRFPDYFHAVVDESYAKVVEVVTREQMLVMARLRAAEEFALDPLETLGRAPLITFLELTEKEAQSLRVFAQEQSDRFDEESKKLNRSTFNQLVSLLPDLAQTKMQSLFKDVW